MWDEGRCTSDHLEMQVPVSTYVVFNMYVCDQNRPTINTEIMTNDSTGVSVILQIPIFQLFKRFDSNMKYV